MTHDEYQVLFIQKNAEIQNKHRMSRIPLTSDTMRTPYSKGTTGASKQN